MKNEEFNSVSYIISGKLQNYRSLFTEICQKAVTYPQGSILTRCGEPLPYMYYLLEGTIKVYTINQNGYTRILGYHKQDTVFAMDGICGFSPAVVTTESVTDIRVLPFTWTELSSIAKRRPEFYPDFLKYYGEVLRLMCYDAENKSISDTSVRVASFLCMYQNETGDRKIRLTQEELASAVNSSRIQLARVIADFKAKGLISCGRGFITLLELPVLSRIAKGEKV